MLLGTSHTQTPQWRCRPKSTKAVVNVGPWGSVAGGNAAALHGEWLEGHGLYSIGKGYRSYGAGLRRFFQQDHVSPFGEGGINSYGFCLGDPINLQDPSGHAPVPYLMFKQAVSRGRQAGRALHVTYLKLRLLRRYAIPYLVMRVNFPGLSRRQLKQQMLMYLSKDSPHNVNLGITMPRTRRSLAVEDSISNYNWVADQMDDMMGTMGLPRLPGLIQHQAAKRVQMLPGAVATVSTGGIFRETEDVLRRHYGPAIKRYMKRLLLDEQRFWAQP